MTRYTRTAREAIRQDAEFTGWDITRYVGAMSLTGTVKAAPRDVFRRGDVTVTVHYTATGTVKAATHVVGETVAVSTGGRDTGKRETVRAWLAVPADDAPADVVTVSPTAAPVDIAAGDIREGDRLADARGVVRSVTHTRNIGDCADGSHYVAVMFSRGRDAQRTSVRFLSTARVDVLRNDTPAATEPVTVTVVEADDIDDAPVCVNDGTPVAREGLLCAACGTAAREYNDITRAALRSETATDGDATDTRPADGRTITPAAHRLATRAAVEARDPERLAKLTADDIARRLDVLADVEHNFRETLRVDSAAHARGEYPAHAVAAVRSGLAYVVETVRVMRETLAALDAADGERVPADAPRETLAGKRDTVRAALRKIDAYRRHVGADASGTVTTADGEREALAAIASAWGWTLDDDASHDQFTVWTREGDTITARFSARPGHPVAGAVYASPDAFGATITRHTVRKADALAEWLTAPVTRILALRDATRPDTDETAAMAHVRIGAFRTFGEARAAIVAKMRGEAGGLAADYLTGARGEGERNAWARERVEALRAGALTFESLACDPFAGEPNGSDVHVLTSGLTWTLRRFDRDPGAALAFRGRV